MTHNLGSRVEDVEERWNDFMELVRQCDEANGTDPFLDQMKKACIISNTLEPWKTHLQAERGKAGKLRCSVRGNRRLLQEKTHLQDDIKREHAR